MIIGIDGHTLNEKEKFGVSTYTYEIASRIIKHTEDQFVIYSKEKLSNSVFHQKNIENRIVNFKIAWTQWGLSTSFLKTKIKPEIMFFPAHSISRYAPMKTAVAIHDLAFLKFPEYFTKKDLFRLSALTIDAAKRSNIILTCSESTKNDIAKFYGKEIANKTKVVLLGFDEKSFNQSCGNINLLKKKYHINKPYLLYAGSFQPRKDLPTLVKAFEQINHKYSDLHLVMAGGGGWMKEIALKAINNSKVKEKIIQLGYVSSLDLPAIYAGANIFVLPSLYEGFGIPLLEAMACGIPVVYANNSSLPEVAGEAGFAFQTSDYEDLAAKLTSLLSDKTIHKEQVNKSLIQSKKFSWDRTAEKTYKILKNVG